MRVLSQLMYSTAVTNVCDGHHSRYCANDLVPPETMCFYGSMIRRRAIVEKGKATAKTAAIAITKQVHTRILVIRGHKVMMDTDLAALYGVSAKRLNEQIKRNLRRFPVDFVFRLTRREAEILRSQNATSKIGHGGRRYLPYAFTEHGAIMAATVLNSQRAVQMSVFVVRAFVRMREAIETNQQIAEKLAELEHKLDDHDGQIHTIVRTIRQLMIPPLRRRRKIGFELPPDTAKIPP